MMGRLADAFLTIPKVWLAVITLAGSAMFGAGLATLGLTAVPSRLAAVEDSVVAHGALFSQHIQDEAVADSVVACYLRALIEERQLGALDCRFGRERR